MKEYRALKIIILIISLVGIIMLSISRIQKKNEEIEGYKSTIQSMVESSDKQERECEYKVDIQRQDSIIAGCYKTIDLLCRDRSKPEKCRNLMYPTCQELQNEER